MKTEYIKNSEKKWHLIDAKGHITGRLAAVAARLLQGKHKVEWSPHIDHGDFVILINANQIQLTGRKWSQKTYYTHSRHIGSLRQKTAQMLPAELILKKAIQGMLPKNKLRSLQLKKLKIYKEDQHPHMAQNPVIFQIGS